MGSVGRQGYPLSLRFRRVPKHLRGHNLDGWSVNALRTVLLEEGAELTVSERASQPASPLLLFSFFVLLSRGGRPALPSIRFL